MMKKMLLVAGLLASVAVARAENAHYVIRVTPALVYIDAGEEDAVQLDETFLVLRADGERHVPIGEIEIVRISSGFSIGEIAYIEQGEAIEVLQRVIAKREWERLGQEAQAAEVVQPAAPLQRSASATGKRSVLVLFGGDWGRDADLSWNPQNDLLAAARSNNGLGVGLRLGHVLDRRWRLNFTYRAGVGAGTTDLSIETDIHRLLSDYDCTGLYVGVGAGLHQLSVDAPGSSDDSANKLGFNATAGVQVPGGHWTLLAETGYQYVVKWGPLIDVSNVRTYIGMARTF